VAPQLLDSWSEPAATTAPVQDEAFQAVLGMNPKTHPCPLPRDFPALFSAPKFTPPTPLLPPSPHFPLTPLPELGRAPKLE